MPGQLGHLLPFLLSAEAEVEVEVEVEVVHEFNIYCRMWLSSDSKCKKLKKKRRKRVLIVEEEEE